MKPIKVVIVTPVHNRRRETLQCLRSIGRSALEGIELHTIVVDDGSTDGTSEAIAAEFPGVEIINGDGNLWYTAGTNRGLAGALEHGPDYVLAINNDSIFDQRCIARLVECAERHPGSVVGALLLDWSTPHRVFQVGQRWETRLGGYRHWFQQTVWTVPDKPWEVDIIVGNCVLYPAKAIREAGLMDEKRLVQYGDAEYTPRMKRLGWRLLIEPRARVFCKPNDPPTGFRKLRFTEKLNHLFVSSASPYSIRRRFHTYRAGAPNPAAALIAIPIFYARVVLGRSPEGPWAMRQAEPPLAETFASAVVDE